MEQQRLNRCLDKLQLKEFPSREKFYLSTVNALVQEIQNAPPDQRPALLKQLHAVDQVYFAQLGSPIEKQILFVRHGKCSKADKNLGLKSNAPLRASAIRAMESTSASSEGLLLSPETAPRVVVSPLVRALKTCQLVLFKREHNKPNISINPLLAENSKAPSGSDLRTYEQFRQMRKALPFFSAKKITFALAEVRYQFNNLIRIIGNLFRKEPKPDELTALKKERDKIIDGLIVKSGGGINNEDKVVTANRNVGLTNQQKIAGIDALIREKGPKDVCLFGHGQNFKAFFSETTGDKSSFDYGEMRKLYLLENGTLVNPPYKFLVNQKTGEIEIEYTGKLTYDKTHQAQAAASPDVAEISDEALSEATETSSLTVLSKLGPPQHEAGSELSLSTAATEAPTQDSVSEIPERDLRISEEPEEEVAVENRSHP